MPALSTPALAVPALADLAPLESRVQEALTGSPYLVASNRLRVEAGEGRVSLHGHVGSFFEKQMAQEVARRIDGVQQVENLLTVAWA
ncbi:BON domain-containing protein [Botrimarina hoheduenensis]|uniref:Periplasmic protein n=1 Tax=Botrimarina hoheduenensis TaxID=2528000 RepID=A0A5C5WGI8_9BACT|nr:BON domain-containing protein [Botrimarina hoheduenensis]TWT48892.1 periplasmic protein [Botrimarina hoheduenensis]